MPYLFDIDAISELLRPRPLPRYVEWLRTVPREDQYTSAVTVGELFKAAYRSRARGSATCATSRSGSCPQ